MWFYWLSLYICKIFFDLPPYKLVICHEEEQVYGRGKAFALKQAETGTPVAEVLHKMGISEQTFYKALAIK